MAYWLYGQPPSLATDDAFFFARALSRFSVLDFSPHFPGYPAFIALGRLFRLAIGDPVSALQAMTTTLALALPIAAAWLAWRWQLTPLEVLAAFLLTLTQPLLPLLALSGLSDGAGLLFFLLFLAMLARPSAWQVLLAGVFLGGAATMRPSLGVVLLAAYMVVFAASWRSALLVAAGACSVVLPALVFVYAMEGWLFFKEAERFLIGHTLVWGNTAFAEDARPKGWTSVLMAQPGLGVLLLLGLLATLRGLLKWADMGRSQGAALVAFVASLLWTIAMQNPENLRHLAPVLVIGAILLPAVHLTRPVLIACLALALASNLATLASNSDLGSLRVSPLAEAVRHLNSRPRGGVLLTNRGVHFLRERLLDYRVYDLIYPASAQAGVSQSEDPIYRLSSQRLPVCVPSRVFRSRVLGEHSFLLYRLEPNTECALRRRLAGQAASPSAEP